MEEAKRIALLEKENFELKRRSRYLVQYGGSVERKYESSC